MLVIKMLLLCAILIVCGYIGFVISKKFSTRVKQLQEIDRDLHIFEDKIKFTYETIPNIFKLISENSSPDIGKIFYEASNNMKIMSAGEAWEEALDNSSTKLTKDDIDVLKGLAKMLGRCDVDGQVSEIRLTEKFINTKIKEAELEKSKNGKLYKTLGLTTGLIIVILLA